MYLLNMINSLGRLSLHSALLMSSTRNVSTSSNLLFKFSPCLLAEPLKKKKRVDPAIVKAREERRKKKLEKQIRRLERNARQLKPIDECEIPFHLIDEKDKRQRKIEINESTLEIRNKIFHAWSHYKQQQNLGDIQMIDRIMYSQQKALDELRNESEELYQEAIQIEPMLLPLKLKGPTETPPVKDYEVPDGDYQDISKKWD